MRTIKSLTLFNAFTFIIQAGLFYSIHFQLVDQNITREITDVYNTLLGPTPDISFKVWGVIYTALAIFCLYHIAMSFTHQEKHPANIDIARTDIFFIINNIAATGWMITTVNGQLLASLVLLAFQLVMLSCIHRRLNIYKRNRRIKSTLATQLPLSIYSAWLSILFLSGINEYLQLYTNRWNIVFIGILVFISLLLIFLRHNIFYGLMMIAGLYGIITKVEALRFDTYDIILAAWIGIGVLSLACFIKLIIDFRLKEPPVVYHKAVYE